MNEVLRNRAEEMMRTYTPLNVDKQILNKIPVKPNSKLPSAHEQSVSDVVSRIEEDQRRMKAHERLWAANKSFLIKENVVAFKKKPLSSVIKREPSYKPQLEIAMSTLSRPGGDMTTNYTIIKDLILLKTGKQVLEKTSYKPNYSKKRNFASADFHGERNTRNIKNIKLEDWSNGKRINKNVLYAYKCILITES